MVIADTFKKTGYQFVQKLIDPTNYLISMKRLLDLGFGELDKANSVSFYKEFIFERLLVSLVPVIGKYTGNELYKTYSYARLYNAGSELKPHRDRPACEFTVTINLANEGDNWPLFLEDRQGVVHEVLLQPGDAIIFKGIELKHWRETKIAGQTYQLFLHYVDRFGPYADERDDIKK